MPRAVIIVVMVVPLIAMVAVPTAVVVAGTGLVAGLHGDRIDLGRLRYRDGVHGLRGRVVAAVVNVAGAGLVSGLTAGLAGHAGRFHYIFHRRRLFVKRKFLRRGGAGRTRYRQGRHRN
jgi:hypothetical protein